MTLFGGFGEFFGNFFVSYAKKTELNREELYKFDDYCPSEVKVLIVKNLQNCYPASDHLIKTGRKALRVSLERNNYFSSVLAIDGNTESTRQVVCLIALKVAAR